MGEFGDGLDEGDSGLLVLFEGLKDGSAHASYTFFMNNKYSYLDPI